MKTEGYIKSSYKYILLYVFCYAAYGAVAPLIGQHLAEIGFNGKQIGSITAAGTFVSMFAIAFWGHEYNESKKHKDHIIIALCLGAAVMAFSLTNIKAYLVFMVCYSIYYFFIQPITVLADAMTVSDEKPFGAIRMWGAVGYALFVYITGVIADSLGLSVIFPIAGASLIVTTVSVLSIAAARKKEGNSGIAGSQNETAARRCGNTSDCGDSGIKSSQNETAARRCGNTSDCGDSGIKSSQNETAARNCKNKKGCENSDIWDGQNETGLKPRKRSESIKNLAKNKKFIKFLVCVFFFGGTNIANNVFFGFLYRDGGGSIAGLGMTFLLMSGSEAPFMALSGWLSCKFGSEKVMVGATLLSALRYAWYATGPGYMGLMGTFFLQGIVNGIMLVELVQYISGITETEDFSLAVSLYYIMGGGISTVFCQLIGGVILDYAGSTAVYLFMSCLNLAGIVTYAVFKFSANREHRMC